MLALAIRPAPAESDVPKVLLSFSPELLTSLVVVAHGEAVPGVAPDVVYSLVVVLAEDFVLGLEFFIYRLNLMASFIKFVLLWPLAPEVLPELVLLESPLHQEAEKTLKILFKGDDLLRGNMIIIHGLVASVRSTKILLYELGEAIGRILEIPALLREFADLHQVRERLPGLVQPVVVDVAHCKQNVGVVIEASNVALDELHQKSVVVLLDLGAVFVCRQRLGGGRLLAVQISCEGFDRGCD